MQGLRSRAGIVAMTAGAIALLSVPVVALAKGPPTVVGGGNQTAESVASPHANIPATNAGQAKKPDPRPKPVSAPKAPKQTPPGQAKPAGQVSAPAGGGNASAGSGPAAKRAKSHASPPAHAYGHAKQRSRQAAEGSSDPAPVNEPAPSGSPDKQSRPDRPDKVDGTGPLKLPPAAAPDSNGSQGAALGAVVSDTVELPADASPDTLPFTGIQLGLLALIGLTSLVGGFALRRTTT